VGISPHLPTARARSPVNAGQAISYLAPWLPCSEDPGTQQEKTEKFNIWRFGRKNKLMSIPFREVI